MQPQDISWLSFAETNVTKEDSSNTSGRIIHQWDGWDHNTFNNTLWDVQLHYIIEKKYCQWKQNHLVNSCVKHQIISVHHFWGVAILHQRCFKKKRRQWRNEWSRCLWTEEAPDVRKPSTLLCSHSSAASTWPGSPQRQTSECLGQTSVIYHTQDAAEWNKYTKLCKCSQTHLTSLNYFRNTKLIGIITQNNDPTHTHTN